MRVRLVQSTEYSSERRKKKQQKKQKHNIQTHVRLGKSRFYTFPYFDKQTNEDPNKESATWRDVQNSKKVEGISQHDSHDSLKSETAI